MKAFHMMGNVLLPKTAEAKSLCKDQKSKKKKVRKSLKIRKKNLSYRDIVKNVISKSLCDFQA